MLTNGFFARIIVLEYDVRGEGQEAKVMEIPERLIATAKWWKDLMPGNGNLQSWHPIPNVVPQSADAMWGSAHGTIADRTPCLGQSTRGPRATRMILN
jgi:hypothetical protein